MATLDRVKTKIQGLINTANTTTGNSDKDLTAAVNALVERANSGTKLPELTEPATQDEVFLNQEYIDANGTKRTGTFTIDSELNQQDSLIAQIQSVINELPDAGSSGSGEPNLQDKIVTPTTSSQTVKADSGYDGLDTVTVKAIPSNYVKPSATKAATTYTPSTTNQTIAAGTYCSGVQTIKGDANLKSENIVSGVSIFGVAGSATSGGGSSGGIETCTVIITNDGSPMAPGMEPVFYYVDQNGTIQQIASVSCTLTVMKNSIIAITGWSAGSNGTGQCSEIFYGIGNAAYSINGDSTLTFSA